jgi:hypothetical protein
MPDTISLGGADYPIAPLKFRDLKRILPLFLTLGIDSESKIDAQGEIVAAAIATLDPTFTRGAFDDLSPTVPELQAAVSAIAILSGRGKPKPPLGLGRHLRPDRHRLRLDLGPDRRPDPAAIRGTGRLLARISAGACAAGCTVPAEA